MDSPPPANSGFVISVEEIEGTAFLQLCGHLDVAGLRDLRAAFDEAFGLGPVVVDLRRLTFIDSIGLATLVASAKARVDEGKSPLQFIRGPDQVQRLFEITQEDTLLEWVEVA